MRKLEQLYPPGYNWREELCSVGILWLLAFFLSWTYLFRLGKVISDLYYYQDGRRFLRSDAVAEPFAEIARRSWVGFAAPLAFLALSVVWHYFSYYRETKSIYVMRRLPRQGVVRSSCIKGPALCAAAVVFAAGILYLLYLGMYWLAVPAECTPRLF